MCGIPWEAFTFILGIGLLMGWLVIQGAVYILSNVKDLWVD